MDLNAFLDNFADSLDGLERSDISPETRFAELPIWDSLALLLTVAMVDGSYGVTLSTAQINECTTLADLAAKVEAQKG